VKGGMRSDWGSRGRWKGVEEWEGWEREAPKKIEGCITERYIPAQCE